MPVFGRGRAGEATLAEEGGKQNGDLHDFGPLEGIGTEGAVRQWARSAGHRGARQRENFGLSSQMAIALISSSLTGCITPFIAAVWPLLRAALDVLHLLLGIGRVRPASLG